jgi:hypothetical protein
MTTFNTHPKSKFWSNKNNITPENVKINSCKKYIFNCDCGHEIEISLYNIKIGKWCSYCCIPGLKLCNDDNCKKCFDNSFSSNEISKYWSKKNLLKPRQVFKTSSKTYLFDCSICGHEIEKKISVIKRLNRLGCSYCINQKLCGIESCIQCYNKSFATIIKKNVWSDKNLLKPFQVSKCSNQEYIFVCKCGNEYKHILSNLLKLKQNSCSCCNKNSKKLCDNEECKFCYDKSFASHTKSKYWSETNILKPRQVFKSSSNKKYIFICEKKHVFKKTTNNINSNSWCPKCINKTETILYNKLIILYPTLQYQYKVLWCKKNKYLLPFDFSIPELNIIIELDGKQHFEQVRNWDNPDLIQKRDKYKMALANENKFSVIRLLQLDVYHNKFNWLEELNNNIEKIKTENKIQNIFMSKNNDYLIYKN